MKGIRDSVSSSSFKYIEIDEDVSPTERPIAVTTRKAYSRVAVVGGGCIVFVLFLLLSMRVAQVVLMPAIVVMQTSLLHDEDRLSLFDAKTMATRGFDVGLLAFGNTECSKLMKAIEIETMHQCNPPQVEDTSLITVDRDTRFQKVLGFGGAFTEAAAINFFKLPEEVQQKVVEMYWSEDGIQYTLGRVPINSCDFSPESYSFDNIAGDTDITYFDTELTRDSAFMMPLMRRANEEVAKWQRSGGDSSPAITIMNGLRDRNIGNDGIGVGSSRSSSSSSGLKLVASPWSPPAWMKQPIKEGAAQSMSGSAEPQGLTDTDEMKRAWALYIAKWVASYEEKGVPIWAITPQNEPEFAAPWEACMWTAEGERDWIRDYLGPTLRRVHPDLKILAFDHNKDHMLDWANTILGDKDVAPFVDGIAFHWYTGSNDRLLDGTYGYNNINKTHYAYPDALLLGTEGCSCPGVELGNWQRAERHGHDVMFDLQNHASGWIDWNLLVDSSGGINHVGNNCDAALVCDGNFSSVHVQPKFFYMGHFSKYVAPGSTRVRSSVVGNFGFDPSLQTGAREGMEVQAWPCEKSSRQQWELYNGGVNEGGGGVVMLRVPVTWMTTYNDDGNDDGKGAKQQHEHEHDHEHHEAYMCFGGIEGYMPSRPYISLVNCDPGNAGYTQHPALQLEHEPGHEKYGGYSFLVDKASGKCLGLAEGVRERGALLELQDCLVSSRSGKAGHGQEGEGGSAWHQQFLYTPETGEIKVRAPNAAGAGVGAEEGGGEEMCLTAGWPFLTGVAFRSPHQGTMSLVVMNEAAKDTKITLVDTVKGTSWFGINGRSIQTIVYG